MKLCFLMGTRPEIIKQGLLVKRAKSMNIDTVVIHSGQHYDYEMSQVFIEEGGVKPDIFLGVKEETHGKQLSEIIGRLESVLLKEKPNYCVVEGDTNTTVAGALVAAKNGIKVAHVEAGCRSFMKTQEEINRIVVDDIADVLFAPSEFAVRNLKKESVRGRIHNVGHIFVEIIKNLRQQNLLGRKTNLEKPSEYVLVTCHRSENVDNRAVLENIVDGLTEVERPIIFPIHPRTEKMLKHNDPLREKLQAIADIRIVQPMGHVEFLSFLQDASVVVTDSGGVQVEASILKVPCVTIRERTEWMETVKAGFNFVVGTDPKSIHSVVERLLDSNYREVLKSKNQPFTGLRASFDMMKKLLVKDQYKKRQGNLGKEEEFRLANTGS